VGIILCIRGGSSWGFETKDSSTIPTGGLIAHYTFDNVVGGTVVDEQGNYNGTIYDLNTTTGHIGNGLLYSNNTAYMSLAGTIDFSNGFTYSAFIKRDSASSSTFLCRSSAFKFNLLTGTAYEIQNLDGSDYQGAMSSTPSGFFHIVITIVGDTFKLYVDGVLEDTFVSNTPFPTHHSSNYPIGRPDYGNKAPVDIDSLRIYNRELTQEEITILSNEQ
jgi:hypothetical protein